MHKFIEQFRYAIEQSGLTPPTAIECDSKIHRFSSSGKPQDKAGWYLLYSDGIPAGCFGDWRTGLNQNWRADIGRSLSSIEEAEHRDRIKKMQIKRQAEEILIKAEAQAKALSMWKKASPAPDTHAYLVKKGITTHSAKQIDGALVLPLRDENGTLHSLQFINENGEKRFLVGGRVSGCYFSIGSIQDAKVLCIVEGFSTGATIHEATNYPIAVAFNAGNLLAVATVMREKFPELTLILCADDDFKVDGNPGLTRATEAAQHVNGLLAVPTFDTNRPDNKTDFNDMAELYGLETVQSAIANAIEPMINDTLKNKVFNIWPDPQPIKSSIAAEPYPLDALPDTIRKAVIEVQSFTKAPIPLVAASAITALSLVGQTYVDIKRAEKLSGPTGLFLITIADSGERKSTCDGFFTRAIHDYVKNKEDTAKPLIKEHSAKLTAWQSKVDGVKTKIRQLAGAGDDTSIQEKELLNLEFIKPTLLKVPKLVYSDITPEALKLNLGTTWPSASIVSSEGGIVFGAHGMNKDSVMRNLATYNQCWDGKSVPTDRISSASLGTQEVRLTMGIQVQEATIREFTSQLGNLARGTGFFARVLFSWPESTQGSRFYTDPPDNWPCLVEFNQRLSRILNTSPPIDSEGILTPKLMTLAALAKLAWVRFHDGLESELHKGGELYDVRDVASKAADNAARLACLFHLLEHGFNGEVGDDSFDRASLIILWHLGEAQRFFGELTLPPELANALLLEEWLIAYCQKEKIKQIPFSKVLQLGPNRLRKSLILKAALQELEDLDRARLITSQKYNYIEINPALLIGSVRNKDDY
ncbi:DUF3987 domain-containing protein [Legionella shakespearei]|uniref:5' DNA primase TraC n=1 Tax=Legionella shakespearei DSM 23087 TaxID=1122169 RepID=A0A0W0Z0X8_9GAMM|nr:DUF3987 domain-containing protein [Legionella shakespearei]KTD62406.1 5' DNA primase TraC [Legionella shakespearei DSM 23087]